MGSRGSERQHVTVFVWSCCLKQSHQSCFYWNIVTRGDFSRKVVYSCLFMFIQRKHNLLGAYSYDSMYSQIPGKPVDQQFLVSNQKSSYFWNSWCSPGIYGGGSFLFYFYFGNVFFCSCFTLCCFCFRFCLCMLVLLSLLPLLLLLSLLPLLLFLSLLPLLLLLSLLPLLLLLLRCFPASVLHWSFFLFLHLFRSSCCLVASCEFLAAFTACVVIFSLKSCFINKRGPYALERKTPKVLWRTKDIY